MDSGVDADMLELIFAQLSQKGRSEGALEGSVNPDTPVTGGFYLQVLAPGCLVLSHRCSVVK